MKTYDVNEKCPACGNKEHILEVCNGAVNCLATKEASLHLHWTCRACCGSFARKTRTEEKPIFAYLGTDRTILPVKTDRSVLAVSSVKPGGDMVFELFECEADAKSECQLRRDLGHKDVSLNRMIVVPPKER